ncbi:MAG: tetratricopeptide repeat protein [Bacteroidota bacterium]
MSTSKISRLAQNIQKNPDDSFSKFALALELLKRDQVEKTQQLFESIYHSDPQYLGVYYHLGKLYQQLNRTDDAQRLFLEGISQAQQQNDTHAERELQEALTQLKDEID